MHCDTVELEINGKKISAIICGRGAPKCWRRCGRRSEFQCDFPVGRYKSGKKKGQVRDCNRHLCPDYAQHGVTHGVDFCDEHYPLAKAAYERKQLNAEHTD
jgi:hypothetical protein